MCLSDRSRNNKHEFSTSDGVVCVSVNYSVSMVVLVSCFICSCYLLCALLSLQFDRFSFLLIRSKNKFCVCVCLCGILCTLIHFHTHFWCDISDRKNWRFFRLQKSCVSYFDLRFSFGFAQLPPHKKRTHAHSCEVFFQVLANRSRLFCWLCFCCFVAWSCHT